MKPTCLQKLRKGIPIALLIFAMGFSAYAQQSAQLDEYRGQQASLIVPDARYVHLGQSGELPAAVKFNAEHDIRAADIVPWIKKVLNTAPEVEFSLMKSQEDQLGYQQDRYQQSYQGIPVYGATYHVQSINGKTTSLRGNALDVRGVNTTPAISEEQARTKALEHFGDANYLWDSPYWETEIKARTGDPTATYYPKGELYVTRFAHFPPGEFKLAYMFDVWAFNREARIFVDASTGEILQTLALASNCEAATVNTIFNGDQGISTDFYADPNYRLYDDCDATDIWVRHWGSATATSSPTEIENTSNTWNNNDDEEFGATVLWECKEAVNYFIDEHSHDSYDNANGDVKAYVNAIFQRSDGTLYTDNASMAFDGSRMKVGLGSAGTLTNSFAAIDIIAHEFTHAVTGTGPGLQYLNESGALNESFSDIFGEMVENYAAGPNDWLGGDDRDDGAARSFIDPNAFGDPDTYLGTNYYTGASDYGGVHTNSSVQNHWFYLLSEGGTGTNDNGDAYDVDGIGRDKAADIAYRNLIHKLSSTSDHADARTGAIEAAEDLYGQCSNEVIQVTNAWHAVGVGDPFDELSFWGDITDVSCHHGSDGEIDLHVDGGTPPYTFDWDDGATTEDRNFLEAGEYFVVVTDDAGCEAHENFHVEEPDDYLFIYVDYSDFYGYGVECYGDANGWAEAYATGGTEPYSFEWDHGESTAEIEDLAPGEYGVMVEDANGCMDYDVIEITEPPLLTASIFDESDYNGYNISCNGYNDGWVTVEASGGVGYYSYYWSDGQTESTATGLSAGDYNVSIYDGNGCYEYISLTISEPPPLTPEITATSDYNGYNISCNGGSDGWATVTPAGGIGVPYTITWSDGQTTATATNLSAGDYWVEVMDDNGCSETVYLTLTEPDPLTIDAGENQTVYYGYPPTECTTISWSGEGGGVPPYTITWSDGGDPTHEVCPGLVTTTYTVTLVDLNGCVMTDDVTVCVIDVRCGKKLNKVAVCHVPEEDPLNEHTICIAIPAVADHLAHGDMLGDCGIDHSCPPTSSRLIAIQEKQEGDLLVAYPNPFNNSTTIAFASEVEGQASLRLFDITGREVAALFNGKAEAGTRYEVEVDGSLVGTGMSYCVLQLADGTVQSVKLIFNR
jgi:Zn-dependent metalloprotease